MNDRLATQLQETGRADVAGASWRDIEEVVAVLGIEPSTLTYVVEQHRICAVIQHGPNGAYRSLPFGMMDLRVYEDEDEVWLTDDDGRNLLQVDVSADAADACITQAADSAFYRWQAWWDG